MFWPRYCAVFKHTVRRRFFVGINSITVTGTFVANYCWSNRVDVIFNKKLLIVNYLVMFTLLRHQYHVVAHILTHSVNLAFGLNPASWINVGFRLQIEARWYFWLQGNSTQYFIHSFVRFHARLSSGKGSGGSSRRTRNTSLFWVISDRSSSSTPRRDHTSRGVTRRGMGSTMPRAPNHWGAPKSPNNVVSTYFDTAHSLPNGFRFENGRQTCFLSRALSNLAKPLQASSKCSHSTCSLVDLWVAFPWA